MITFLLPWALKNCPTCAQIKKNDQPPFELAACKLLSSIAQSIIFGPAMDVSTLEEIDPGWIEKPRNHFYKLPDHCAAFITTD
jgi:hypothetical protein